MGIVEFLQLDFERKMQVVVRLGEGDQCKLFLHPLADFLGGFVQLEKEMAERVFCFCAGP